MPAPVGIAQWDTIRDAIQAQIVAASGLDGPHVIWARQGADRPSGSFISLEVIGTIDSDAPTTPQNTTLDNPASNGNDGIEILMRSEEPISFSIRLNFYKGTKTGAGSAWARLSTILRFLGASEAVSAALDVAKVSLIECGSITDLSAILETEYEGRAAADLRFSVIDGYEEATTYIQTATIENEIKRPDGTILPPGV